jgi:23S rRNA G2069 N7-methylase RlmK/C1962 C5-methylase RlmI
MLVLAGATLMVVRAFPPQENKLLEFVQAAARKTNRQLTIMKTLSGAACHTQNPGYPEGTYLSGLLVCVR